MVPTHIFILLFLGNENLITLESHRYKKCVCSPILFDFKKLFGQIEVVFPNEVTV